MAGMKPKILCPKCSSIITLSDIKCPSCGVEIQWEENVPSKSNSKTVKQSNNKPQKESTTPAFSLKSILAVIVVAAAAIVIYEVITGGNVSTDSSLSTPPPSKSPTSNEKQLQAEIQSLENQIATNPDNQSLVLQLANILHDGMMFEKAISKYKQYLEKNEKDPNARVDLGICYKELGNFKEAKKQMREALKYSPKHLFGHFNLGVVCLVEGNVQESNEWFRKTVALDPSSDVGKRAQQILTQHNSQSLIPKQ